MGEQEPEQLAPVYPLRERNQETILGKVRFLGRMSVEELTCLRGQLTEQIETAQLERVMVDWELLSRPEDAS